MQFFNQHDGPLRPRDEQIDRILRRRRWGTSPKPLNRNLISKRPQSKTYLKTAARSDLVAALLPVPLVQARCSRQPRPCSRRFETGSAISVVRTACLCAAVVATQVRQVKSVANRELPSMRLSVFI